MSADLTNARTWNYGRSFAISVILGINCASTASAELDFVNASSRIKPSIVHIEVVVPPAEGSRRVGTGTLIDASGQVLTVEHLFRNKNGQPLQIVSLRGSIGDGRAAHYDMVLVERIKERDLALLRFTEKPKGFVPAKFCSDSPAGGQFLMGYGFPQDQALAPLIVTFAEPAGRWWQVSADFAGGMSGGPIVDQRGIVRAIIKGGLKDEAAVRWIIPSSYAGSWLSRAGTQLDCSKVPEEDRTSLEVRIDRVRCEESYQHYNSSTCFADVTSYSRNAAPVACEAFIVASYPRGNGQSKETKKLAVDHSSSRQVTQSLSFVVPLDAASHTKIDVDSSFCRPTHP